MRCYNCGFDLSENDFCTACGADVKLYKRIMHLSNRYYNEGLGKARVRDLSGSAECLRLSLKCNKYNTEARNLLGLVCFEMGDAVGAISEWVISKNFQPQKNIADTFMSQVQNNPAKWDNIRQSIIKYNKALEYSRQGSLDMAVIQLKSLIKMNPKMVRAYQLLALLYMNSEEWDKALRCIKRVAAIDTNNTTTLLYRQEIDEFIRHRDEEDPEGAARRRKKKNQRDVIEYVSGNETIIQPLNYSEKNTAVTTAVNIVIGLAIGFAIVWFLVLPGSMKAAQEKANESMADMSSQLTEKSARLDELQKRTEALEEDNSQLKSQLEGYTGDDGPQGAANVLMRAARDFIEGERESAEIAAEIMSIDYDYATGEDAPEDFKELYATMRKDVCEKASAEYLEKGLEDLKEDAYESAIENLTRAVDMDDKNAEALYNLAHAYRRSEQGDIARELYVRVIEQFPDSDYAKGARDYVNDDDIAGVREAAEAPAETAGDDAAADDGGQAGEADGNGDAAGETEEVTGAVPVIVMPNAETDAESPAPAAGAEAALD